MILFHKIFLQPRVFNLHPLVGTSVFVADEGNALGLVAVCGHWHPGDCGDFWRIIFQVVIIFIVIVLVVKLFLWAAMAYGVGGDEASKLHGEIS